jgi:hypothetical protein
MGNKIQKKDMAEMSDIHTSAEYPYPHVDVYYYDEKGRKEKEKHGFPVK